MLNYFKTGQIYEPEKSNSHVFSYSTILESKENKYKMQVQKAPLGLACFTHDQVHPKMQHFYSRASLILFAHGDGNKQVSTTPKVFPCRNQPQKPKS